MYTFQELNDSIASITTRISFFYPELEQNIIETPVLKTPNNGSVISLNSLTDYYDSLNNVLKHYSKTHLN